MNSGKELITTLQRYLGKHPDFPIMKITEDLEITIADTFDDFISDRK